MQLHVAYFQNIIRKHKMLDCGYKSSSGSSTASSDGYKWTTLINAEAKPNVLLYRGSLDKSGV